MNKKNTYNIVAKCVKGAEYFMSDMIATKLSKLEFEKIKEWNKGLFEDYRFIPYSQTDFTWWVRISKYLTKHKIKSGCNFDIDYFGNITKY